MSSSKPSGLTWQETLASANTSGNVAVFPRTSGPVVVVVAFSLVEVVSGAVEVVVPVSLVVVPGSEVEVVEAALESARATKSSPPDGAPKATPVEKTEVVVVLAGRSTPVGTPSSDIVREKPLRPTDTTGACPFLILTARGPVAETSSSALSPWTSLVSMVCHAPCASWK